MVRPHRSKYAPILHHLLTHITKVRFKQGYLILTMTSSSYKASEVPLAEESPGVVCGQEQSQNQVTEVNHVHYDTAAPSAPPSNKGKAAAYPVDEDERTAAAESLSNRAKGALVTAFSRSQSSAEWCQAERALMESSQAQQSEALKFYQMLLGLEAGFPEHHFRGYQPSGCLMNLYKASCFLKATDKQHFRHAASAIDGFLINKYGQGTVEAAPEEAERGPPISMMRGAPPDVAANGQVRIALEDLKARNDKYGFNALRSLLDLYQLVVVPFSVAR